MIVAVRLPWTDILALYFVPQSILVLIGFDPYLVMTGRVINFYYQFHLHTELVKKLGFLELFLNTPSHHRVHHASNSNYLDKNFGGIFII